MTRWTRELIIQKIREWNDRFGEPPCSADWNPALARWRAQEWRIERYQAGSWPSTNAAKRPFEGSFDAAVRAAGLEPHRPGPRRRAPGTASPSIAQRAPQAPRSVDEALLDASERVRAAERRAVALERELAAAERRANRAEDRLSDARVRARRAGERERRARGARERVLVAEREASTNVELLAADADARVRAAYDQAQAALVDTLDARRTARAAEARAADALARAEAAERLFEAATASGAITAAANGDATATRGGTATVNGAAANGDATATRGDAATTPAVDVDAAVSAAEERARREAAGAVSAALTAARAAEARAAAAERRARELATLVCGEPRQLSRDELEQLRAVGPTGPAVMANALRVLHKARAAGDRRELTSALGDVASAAIGWRDRL
ncbi:MAG TPA: hypothetical protein VNS09_14360 [Solirubrobacter sp.]|nr:hypothetical protein [Solirubrobacter sp.]